MIIRFLLLVLTIISVEGRVFAAEDKIVAIVNKEPITLSKLEQRKKIMRFFGHVPSLSAEQEKAFTVSILDSLVEDEILTQYADKFKITVADTDIKDFLTMIETNNKMPTGYLEKSVMNLHVSQEAFKDTIRMNVLRSRIINEILGSQIKVTRSEIDSLILDTNSRDAKLSLKIFTGKRNNLKTLKSMRKLSHRIKGCDNISGLRYQSFATLNETEAMLSSLTTNLQEVLKHISIGHSTIVQDGDKSQVVLLCSREVQGFPDNEVNQVYHNILNKQLNNKARKFLQNLRKKAYVKILLDK